MRNFFRKVKENFNLNSITKRLTFVVALLSFITTVAFVSGVFLILRDQSFNRTLSNSQKDMTLVLEKMDMFFKSVRNDAVTVLVGDSCQTILSNSDDFLSANTEIQYKKYRLMQEVVNSSINHKSTYKTIVLYDMNANQYTNDRLITDEYSLSKQVDHISMFYESDNNELILGTHKSPWREKKDNEYIDCISYLRKVYSKDGGKLLGVVELEIPIEEIYSLYEAVEVNGISIFFASDDKVILSRKEERLYKNLNSESWYHELEQQELENGFKTFTSDLALYIVKEYETVDWTAFCVIPESVYLAIIEQYALYNIIIGVVLLFVSLSFIYFVIKSITEPLRKITRTIVDIRKGNYRKRVSLMDGGEIGTLSDEFNHMLDKTEVLMTEIVEKEEEKREYALSLIQMQMTPHFFYNILESICGLIVIDEKKQAINAINHLSRFYRGVLNKGKEIITIEQELEIAINYLEIMKICYPNKFSFEVKCADNLKKNCVCKLIIQPILENCIHHGFNGVTADGIIEIKVSQEADVLILEVKDNGKGFDTGKDISGSTDSVFSMEGFGLGNTDERIKLYFGTEYGINVSSSSRGTIIRIKLPIMELSPIGDSEKE